ncbi:hypothetical protein RO1_05220 [Roseburia intestinalis XB6B4]|uniref:Uncharacterized protein n=1 Tax=Roseburia intestinalis XB6B4 TaxID=718255 RepID=D4KV83_9FIRM|nr:hypothetical protein RO1_05220 [Roseburia intestinalis XB6B4]
MYLISEILNILCYRYYKKTMSKPEKIFSGFDMVFLQQVIYSKKSY